VSVIIWADALKTVHARNDREKCATPDFIDILPEYFL